MINNSFRLVLRFELPDLESCERLCAVISREIPGTQFKYWKGADTSNPPTIRYALLRRVLLTNGSEMRLPHLHSAARRAGYSKEYRAMSKDIAAMALIRQVVIRKDTDLNRVFVRAVV